MSAGAEAPDSQQDIAEAAARWFSARRRHIDRVEEEAFQAWLEANPANREAYEEITRSWEIAGIAASDPRLIAMRSEALMMRARDKREYTRLWGALATAAMLVLTVSGIYLADPGFMRGSMGGRAQSGEVVLRTGVGQRATATLADGSTVTLNTNSVLHVDYGKQRRDVRLLAGQVLFEVAKDAARPFVVSAADRQIVALGTEFEVRLDGERVRVALLEGQVRVEPAKASSAKRAAPRSAAILHPGEQLLVTTKGDVLVKPAQVEDIVSWRSGRVRFDDTPLAEAVAEMNRYSKTPIEIRDPEIAAMRVSGAFRTGQSRSFAEALSEAYPLDAQVTAEKITLHRGS